MAPPDGYLAVVPERFSEALEPLLARRRELGLEVTVLRPRGRGAEELSAEVRAELPRYVLLVGDHEEVPSFVDEWEATDNGYGDLDGDGLPEAAVGRLPADTPEELSCMVRRTLEAEREPDAGEWRNDLAFLAGQGGFGPVLDRMLEQVYREVIVRHVPAAYDVDMSYANPTSPYCYPPPLLSGAALERADRGSLIYTYVGHGYEEGFDEVQWRGRNYPILSSEDASRMDSVHPPVMVVIACLTGRFDGVEGIGEVLMKRPRGPLAFLGASRVSQPYSNAVLGLELVRAALDPEVATVGEMARRARRALVEGEVDETRTLIDSLALLLIPAEEQSGQREENVRLYNLLGDPAAPLLRPDSEVRLKTRREEGVLAVRGRVDGLGAATGYLVLECPRERAAAGILPVDPEDPRAEELMRAHHARANDPAVTPRLALGVEGGAFEARLPLPADLPPGDYVLKCFLSDGRRCAQGAREWTNEPPSADGDSGGGQDEGPR